MANVNRVIPLLASNFKIPSITSVELNYLISATV